MQTVTESGYVDQLIDPSITDDQYVDDLQAEESEPLGRRYFSIEYQHYKERQDPDDLTGNGVLLNWQRETLDYGEFHLEAVGTLMVFANRLVQKSGQILKNWAIVRIDTKFR